MAALPGRALALPTLTPDASATEAGSDTAPCKAGGTRSAYNKSMSVQVDAVYQNGILRPLQPLHLPENERVVVTVSSVSSTLGFGQVDTEYVESLVRRLAGAEPAPGLAGLYWEGSERGPMWLGSE